MKRKISFAGILFLFLIFLNLFTVWASEPFELHLLDVGQGQSVLMKADGHAMMIDGGGRETSSFVVSYLKQQGIESLDYVIASHYDTDHIAGLIGVLSVFKVDTLLLPVCTGEGDLFYSFSAAAVSNGCTICHACKDMEFGLGSASIEVIGPVNTDYVFDNDGSLAVRILYGNRSCVICGDAEQQSEMDMAASGEDLQTDLYVVNHHGSRTSSTDVFLDALSPGYALISCGKNNEYGHPAVETLQRLKSRGVKLYRTDQQGTIIAFSDGENIWFNQDACEDWTSGNSVVNIEADSEYENQETDRQIPEDIDGISEKQSEPTCEYVCNTNTKKFHYPDCSSVPDIKPGNRYDYEGSREEVLAMGYVPCKRCNP